MADFHHKVALHSLMTASLMIADCLTLFNWGGQPLATAQIMAYVMNTSEYSIEYAQTFSVSRVHPITATASYPLYSARQHNTTQKFFHTYGLHLHLWHLADALIQSDLQFDHFYTGRRR